MSSHYRISFSQVVEDAVSFATEQLMNIANKTKAFLRQRIVEDVNLYRQFNNYHGVPVTSFWEKQFGEVKIPVSPSVRPQNLNRTGHSDANRVRQDIIDRLSPQQVLVFNKIRDIAFAKGYQISALPAPSQDLIIDLYGFDAQETRIREKVFARRR